MTKRPPQILIAEDNMALASVMRFNLERVGMRTVVARNGLEAWNHLQHDDFDFLVTDHQMPELTGCDLCRRMRNDARFADTPIVLLTSKGLELELPKLREDLGILALFPKPFSPLEIVQLIQGHLAPLASET